MYLSVSSFTLYLHMNSMQGANDASLHATWFVAARTALIGMNKREGDDKSSAPRRNFSISHVYKIVSLY
jgi:hypothetical protein